MPVHDYTPTSTLTPPPTFGYPESTPTDKPLQLHYLPVRDGVLVSTTTIIPSGTPTATIVEGDGSPPVPIAAIVGGTVAGVLLAVGIVVAWVSWGRCIKREQRKEKQELVSDPSNSSNWSNIFLAELFPSHLGTYSFVCWK